MQFSRALRALPVVCWLGPSAPDASLAAQARYRISTDGAWFFQEAGGKRLARLARGAQVAGGDARGDWLAVTLEGWIFATSVGPTPRAGFDLAVTRTPEENLRSAPAGALVGKLPQGFVLTKVSGGDTDRWVHVTRAGWVQSGDVGPVATGVSSRTAADSDTAAARRTVLYRAPEGAPSGTLAPSAPLRVLGRSGDWTRVEIDGWVRSGDLQAAPAGVLVGVSAGELRAEPQRYVGQVLRWTLQFIAVQKADELRPDMPNGATYLLARGPLPERGFVYVVVPDAKRAQLDALTPLATVQVTARVRAGRTRFLGNPVLDLMSLETLP